MRQDLSLPRVVCEYEDVFPDELPGLPPYRDVDFTIELHSGTTPIATTLEWRLLSCRNLRSNYKTYRTKDLLDRALHLRALWCCLPRKRTRPFNYALTADVEQGNDQESVSFTED